jgi:hypothetical protein
MRHLVPAAADSAAMVQIELPALHVAVSQKCVVF